MSAGCTLRLDWPLRRAFAAHCRRANKPSAVAQVQDKLSQRVAEVDLEVHEDAFQYWRRRDAKPAGRR